MSTQERIYSQPDVVAFVAEMEDLGAEVEHYRGRNFWEGPAVRTGDFSRSELLAATSVECQWDQMGLGYIVYPRVSDSGVNDADAIHCPPVD